MTKFRFRHLLSVLGIVLVNLLLVTNVSAVQPPSDEGCQFNCSQTDPSDGGDSEENFGLSAVRTLPNGITTSLFGAYNQNPLGTKTFHTTGYSSAPSGYHQYLANDASQDGRVMWGNYNKSITLSGPGPLGEGQVAFIKSWQGLSEIFEFDANSLRILQEQMDWDRNSWTRRLKDSSGTKGALWMRLDVPPSTDVVEKILLDYYRCVEPRQIGDLGQLFDQPFTYAMNRIYGPYDISTPDGLAQARSDAQFIANKDNPLGVPDAWLTFPAQLGHPNAHAILYLMRDMWGPRDSRPIKFETHWGNMEFYAYIEVVELNNSWRRGTGLVGWGALDEPNFNFSGHFVVYRQAIQTTVVWDARTRPLRVCELPGSGPIEVGLGMLNSFHHDRGYEDFLIPEGLDQWRAPSTPQGHRRRGIMKPYFVRE